MKYKISFLLTLLLLLASCQQELAPDAAGTSTGKGHISFRVASMASGGALSLDDVEFKSVSSKADRNPLLDAQEAAVKRIDMIFFDAGTKAYLGIYSTSSVNISNFSPSLPSTVIGKTCNIYFIANLPVAPTGFTTETAFMLSSSGFKTLLQAEVAASGIPMFGSLLNCIIPSDGVIKNAPVTLTRMLARVDVVYSNIVPAAAGLTVSDLQLCNVPSITPYYAYLTTVPTTYYNGMAVSNLPAEANLPAAGATGKYTYYIPANLRGTDANTDPRLKLGNGITDPTYVKITGALAGNVPLIYVFYLGGNETNDYNILPNTKYTVNASLKGVSKNDKRVKTNMNLYSNCYIVKPGGSVTIHTGIVNYARSCYSSANIGALPATYAASVLWQTSTSPSYIRIDNPNCTGGIFTVSTPVDAAPGNAVVCIMNGSNILWSWHIWVTNFDPFSTAKPYNGLNFMDRNLGAIVPAPATTAPDAGSFGLYYQWGRKDPFAGPSAVAPVSSPQTLYPSTGSPAYVVPYATSGGTIANVVLNPTTFYTGVGAGYDWNTIPDGTLWGGDTTKSVFDPCPLGWRVPIYKGGVSPFAGLDHNLFSWNPTAQCRTIDSNSYPATGIKGENGYFSGVGYEAKYWIGSPNASVYSSLISYNDGYVNPENGYTRYTCVPVRCVQE